LPPSIGQVTPYLPQQARQGSEKEAATASRVRRRRGKGDGAALVGVAGVVDIDAVLLKDRVGGGLGPAQHLAHGLAVLLLAVVSAGAEGVARVRAELAGVAAVELPRQRTNVLSLLRLKPSKRVQGAKMKKRFDARQQSRPVHPRRWS